MNVGVRANPAYGGSWWGEGEVKIFLDGDSGFPTLCGTGTEDYIGSAWGQRKFANRFQGCPVADEQKAEWAFYRFHVPDPVYFENDCRVVLPQIGGNSKEKVIEMVKAGIPMKPISVHNARCSSNCSRWNPCPTCPTRNFRMVGSIFTGRTMCRQRLISIWTDRRTDSRRWRRRALGSPARRNSAGHFRRGYHCGDVRRKRQEDLYG